MILLLDKVCICGESQQVCCPGLDENKIGDVSASADESKKMELCPGIPEDFLQYAAKSSW